MPLVEQTLLTLPKHLGFRFFFRFRVTQPVFLCCISCIYPGIYIYITVLRFIFDHGVVGFADLYLPLYYLRIILMELVFYKKKDKNSNDSLSLFV